METLGKWLTGVTVVAVVATLVSSRYTAGIFTAAGGAVAKVYQGAKK